MNSHEKTPEFFTLDEIAVALRVTPAAVTQLANAGILPMIQVGAAKRFNLSDCLKALQAQGNSSKAGDAA